jgi:hypothetical protein
VKGFFWTVLNFAGFCLGISLIGAALVGGVSVAFISGLGPWWLVLSMPLAFIVAGVVVALMDWFLH